MASLTVIRRRLGHSSLAKDEHNNQILGVDHLTFEGGGGLWKNWFVQDFFSHRLVFFLLLRLCRNFFHIFDLPSKVKWSAPNYGLTSKSTSVLITTGIEFVTIFFCKNALFLGRG